MQGNRQRISEPGRATEQECCPERTERDGDVTPHSRQHPRCRSDEARDREGAPTPLPARDPDGVGQQQERHDRQIRGIEQVTTPDPNQELPADGDPGGSHTPTRVRAAQQQNQGQR